MRKQQYFIFILLAVGAMAFAAVDRSEPVGMEKSRASSPAASEQRERELATDEIRREERAQADRSLEDARAQDRLESTQSENLVDQKQLQDFRELRGSVRLNQDVPDDVELRNRVEPEDTMTESTDDVGDSVYRE